MSEEDAVLPLRVLEMYSGIGGFRYALDIACETLQQQHHRRKFVIAYCQPFDNNAQANDTYVCNTHPHSAPPNTMNLEHVTAAMFETLNCNVWTMSPPCQPYTRGGSRKMDQDTRACSFHHIMTNVLPQMNPTEMPRVIVIENVVGFEESPSFALVVGTAKGLGYTLSWRNENPRDCGVPNVRRRVYITLLKTIRPIGTIVAPQLPPPLSAGSSLREWLTPPQTSSTPPDTFVSPEMLATTCPTYIFVVATPHSTLTECFTKGYGENARGAQEDKPLKKFVYGSGSLLLALQSGGENDAIFQKLVTKHGDADHVLRMTGSDIGDPQYRDFFETNKLRLFRSSEVAALMTFPSTFRFPPHLTETQRLRLLGNSLCVYSAARVLFDA
eukprot:PhF_6_TR5211/c0_g1_i1/m.7511/K15336/TRDMT1, DNMT2; tRNA (cytosine38-C5)-methyltransferase